MVLSFQKISYHYPYKHISLIVYGFSSLSSAFVLYAVFMYNK